MQACPFVLDVFTEDNEGEIEIVDLLPATPHVDPALTVLVKERGVSEAVMEGMGQLNTYTFTTPHMTTIAVENKVRTFWDDMAICTLLYSSFRNTCVRMYIRNV